MGRGTFDGWYAYWFLNPAAQTLGALSHSIIGMLALFAGVAAIAVVVDRKLAEKF